MVQLDVGSPPRPTWATRSGLPVPLTVGAGLALAAAVAADVSGYEHPTHVLVLVLAVAAAALVRHRWSGAAGMVGSVAGVVVLQPALDLIGELAPAGSELGGTGISHLLFAEGPAAGMQVVLSVALVVATAGVAHCTGLFEPARLSVRPRPSAPLDAIGHLATRARDVRRRPRRHRGHAAPVSRRGPPRRRPS